MLYAYNRTLKGLTYIYMMDRDASNYRQLYFDIDGTIKQETYVFHREMTAEEQEHYDTLVSDSNQMTIFDFITA